MNFRDLLDTLARSSAEAVSTLSKSSDEIEDLRSYLYIETEIERRFVDTLRSTNAPQSIIFLCGSSGDGKSEILRRHHTLYKDDFLFHLDATHSLTPYQNAVEALNDLFDRHREAKKPLIVGINIGMLLNFHNSGAKQHDDIKQAISRFIEGERAFGHFQFLNFEDYPKFCLKEGKVVSDFISALLDKVTADDPNNLLFLAYQSDHASENAKTRQNYLILQQKPVKELVVQTLLQAHLKYDLFFSARALLDFIHNLLAGGSNLFDNLFASTNGGLASSLENMDPCLIRTQLLDEFVVQQSLGVPDTGFDEFRQSFSERFGDIEMSPTSWVRAFYVLQGVEIGDNYHHRFVDSFKQTLFDEYIRFWQLHQTLSDKRELRDFYDNYLTAALLKFANRLVPQVVGDGIYLAERNGVVLSAKVRISMDNKTLTETSNSKRIQSFYAALKVGKKSITPFPITISFLELAQRILAGYRPNRHDKNTVVILEEVIEEIIKQATKGGEIRFHKSGKRWLLRMEDDEFLVEKEA